MKTIHLFTGGLAFAALAALAQPPTQNRAGTAAPTQAPNTTSPDPGPPTLPDVRGSQGRATGAPRLPGVQEGQGRATGAPGLPSVRGSEGRATGTSRLNPGEPTRTWTDTDRGGEEWEDATGQSAGEGGFQEDGLGDSTDDGLEEPQEDTFGRDSGQSRDGTYPEAPEAPTPETSTSTPGGAPGTSGAAGSGF